MGLPAENRIRFGRRSLIGKTVKHRKNRTGAQTDESLRQAVQRGLRGLPDGFDDLRRLKGHGLALL